MSCHPGRGNAPVVQLGTGITKRVLPESCLRSGCRRGVPAADRAVSAAPACEGGEHGRATSRGALAVSGDRIPLHLPTGAGRTSVSTVSVDRVRQYGLQSRFAVDCASDAGRLRPVRDDLPRWKCC